MVNALAQKLQPSQSQNDTPQRESLSTHVRASEVFRSDLRLEAGAFSIEARRAYQNVLTGGLRAIPLYGADGVCQQAYNAFRFRRVYVSADYGVPFVSSSDIIRLDDPNENYLSRKLTSKLDQLLIKKSDVLISCSGTVGNVALAGELLAGKALSQHAIRLRLGEANVAGFITAFLRSRYGRPQLTKASYGSVISHIEPEHLKAIIIPEPTPFLQTQIGRPMVDATSKRDEANRIITSAIASLIEQLGLPSIELLRQKVDRKERRAIRTSQLADRLEASYHSGLVRAIEKELAKLKEVVAPLSDPKTTKEIRPITKFRKRVYVPIGGIPLLSSKQLFQVDPVDVNRLAKGAHTKDMAEIALKAGMIAVTRSGTIGRVQIIPGYMEGWAGSEHAIRVIVDDPVESGYLFAWLASEYGYALITRNQYGSVILEIDKEMLGSVPIPMLPKSKREKIGEAIVKANDLRNAAWNLEQDAIAKLEHLVATHGVSIGKPHEREFYILANEWQAETRHLSSAEQVSAHPAYQKIVAMKDAAIPLILQELTERPANWFRALHDITGDNPVPEASRGILSEMATAWLTWGRGKGYRV